MTAAAIPLDKAPAGERVRIASLDVMRGAVIVGMIVVNSAAYLKYAGGYPAYGWLMHSHWAGFSLADAVFPAFVFMVGVSLVWSLEPAKREGVGAQVYADVGLRALRLILVGLLLSNMYWLADSAANAFRPMGVLQRIGLVYLAAALLYLTTGPCTRLAIASVLLLGYWPLLLLPFPDARTDLAVPGMSFVSWVDRAVLGGHAYVKGAAGYDPEGLLSTLPAIAQGLIGIAAGEWLKARGREPKGLAMLAAAGAGLAALGLAWSPLLPVTKDMWSPSFVLLSSGLSMLALAGLYYALDLKGWRLAGAGVFAVFGVNAIAAYVLHMLASGVLTADALRAAYDFTSGFLAPPAAALVPVLIFLLMLWAAMAYLAARRWYVRI